MKVKAIIFVHNFFEWKSILPALFVWPLIRLFTWSPWNHCALLCEENGVEFIVEALGKGVTQTSMEAWQVRAKRKTEFIYGTFYPIWLRGAIGIPYDYKSLLVWKLIKILTGKWYGPKWEQAKKAVFCSELAAMVVGCEHPWDMSPAEVYEYLTDKIRK